MCDRIEERAEEGAGFDDNRFRIVGSKRLEFPCVHCGRPRVIVLQRIGRFGEEENAPSVRLIAGKQRRVPRRLCIKTTLWRASGCSVLRLPKLYRV